MTNKIALNVNEAATYSGIGRNTLRTLIRWKKLSSIRVGNKFLIRTETLDKFLLVNEGNDLKNRFEIIAV